MIMIMKWCYQKKASQLKHEMEMLIPVGGNKNQYHSLLYVFASFLMEENVSVVHKSEWMNLFMITFNFFGPSK